VSSVTATAWAIVGLLILANALYVAAEFGAVGVRRSRVRRLAEDGNGWARRLLPFVETPAALDRYVGASQIGITLSSLMLGAYAQAAISRPLAPHVAALFDIERVVAYPAVTIAVLLLLTAVQLVIGELAPKAVALRYPTETALFTVLPMQWSLRLFGPFLWLLNGTANLLLRLVGTRQSAHGHLHSPEEIELLIAESRDGGLLEAEEQRRLQRALHLSQRRARDLMVPLERLTMLEASMTWEEILRSVAASPFSRLPVYLSDRIRVVGVLHVKDLVDHYIAEGPLPLERFMRPVVRVEADAPADRIIGVLRERRTHQAVVADADGRALGLVTIQDLLAALLGSADTARDARPA
jgi:CBS domain containing-hemolysin-like protein